MENLIVKTGFENVISNDNSEYKLQIMSLMTVFMQNALKTANIYTKHSNRNIITSMDISLGLKKELFTFLDNDDIEERALRIFNEFKNEEFVTSSSDNEDESGEESEEKNEYNNEEFVSPNSNSNNEKIYDIEKKNETEEEEITGSCGS